MLEFDWVTNQEMKVMITKEYYRGIRKILKASLNTGNTIQTINARAVSITRYGTGIVERRKKKLQAIDRETRKLLTMYRSLHPRADVDMLYWKRKNSGTGLIIVEECVRIEKISKGFYLKEQGQKLLTEAVIEGVISDDENPKGVKTRLLQQRKENYTYKRMHSAFMRGTEEVRTTTTGYGLKKDI